MEKKKVHECVEDVNSTTPTDYTHRRSLRSGYTPILGH